MVSVAHVEIGGVSLEGQPFAAIDLAPLMRRVEGDDVAGILGYEIVRRLPVRIDYEHDILTLYRPRGFAPPHGAVRIPFTLHGRVPQVRASVDGIEGAFDVDTGSRASLTLSAPFVDGHGLIAKYGATREVIAGAGAGGYARALLARVGKLALQGVDVEAPVTYLSSDARGPFADPALAGNIGYGVLRRFNVTFDYARSALYVEKNSHFAERDLHERAGLWLERGVRGFDVVDVVADSPAQAAGLVVGDVIVAVDGKPAKSMTLADARALLRGAPGTKLRLRPERKLKGANEAIVVAARSHLAHAIFRRRRSVTLQRPSLRNDRVVSQETPHVPPCGVAREESAAGC